MKIIPRNEFPNHPLLSRLLELHDIPEKIYIEGELPEISIDEYGRANPRILTIVGSRKHTTYSVDVIENLLRNLSGSPVIILSGLALGVDCMSHKSALKYNLKTIAVPGSGLDKKVLYPKTNLSLAEEILANDGALLSEFDPLTPPALWTFPARNRIMAALSDAVLIIEAEEKSGTLITARQALELGRDIGAIPGNIFSKTSDGTNMLIREGAYAIRNIKDLHDLLHISVEEKENIINENLTDLEKIIIDLLNEPKEKDALLIESKLSPTDFLITLSSLEIKGMIQETFGEIRIIV
ncbi:TPA: DNA-protecting protein DprA [Candidatus Nomurabacteria bacterium]|nr:DNA-protecting protein DprA [Candidatus Nomurabacteria bacterium]